MIDWLRKRFTGIHASNLTSASEQQATHKSAEAHKQHGDEYLDLGRYAEAESCYRDALICNPHFAEALGNLSSACRALQRYDEAEDCLRRAIHIKPNDANLHYNLATLLMMSRRQDEAIDEFAEAVHFNPEHDAARAVMLHLMQLACHWRTLEEHSQVLRRSAINPATIPESVISPFIFVALPGTTLHEQFCCAKKWARAEYGHLAGMRVSLGFSHARALGQKVNVGYLSGDLSDHPVAKLMAEVVALHDRDRFRVVAYSYGPDDKSALRSQLKAAFDEFVDIQACSDVDAAKRIYSDKVDVLVDLTGYTKNSRTGILALQPSPKQIAFLGYPGTLGAEFVDYFITDRFVTPPETQKYFSEKFLYMPNSFFPANRTQNIAKVAPSRHACGLPDHGFVFCCFNKSYKLSPQVFSVWMRLLRAVAGSVLWLSDCDAPAKTNLRHEASRLGVDEQRIVFAPRTDTVAEHLARHCHADLFLDTLPYNAHTTCSDALWMGLPVVTCAGATFTSRVAGSLLSAIGLPELITYRLEDYYKLALELARDASRLATIRRKLLAHRDTTSLFDSMGFTRGLENLYTSVLAPSPTANAR